MNFYKSLIHPYLTYGFPAWGQAGETYLNKIPILQKRALRLLFFADVRDHAIPLFLEANVLPITFLYHETYSQKLLKNSVSISMSMTLENLKKVRKEETEA